MYLASLYRMLYHSEKLMDLKNFLYKPAHSPLIPDVSCGPDASNVAKKSSGLKGLGNGAACENQMQKIITMLSTTKKRSLVSVAYLQGRNILF